MTLSVMSCDDEGNDRDGVGVGGMTVQEALVVAVKVIRLQ